MKRCIPMTVLAIWTALVVNASAGQHLVELVPTHDTYGQSRFRSGLADNINGSFASFLFVGGDTSDDHNRIWLRFDLTGQTMAAGDGTLRLVINNPYIGEGRTLEVFKIKSSNAGWDELDSSWNHRIASARIAWDGGGGLGAPGTGGYEGTTPNSTTPLDTLVFPSGLSQSDTIDLTIPRSVLQGWINNPAGNAGLLLRDSDEAALVRPPGAGIMQVVFYPKDNPVADRHPMLTFAIPEPSSLVLAGMGLAGLLLCLWRKRKMKA